MSPFESREPRTKTLIVRMTEEEHATLAAAAEARGMSMSDLVRDAISKTVDHRSRPSRNRKRKR